MIVYSKDHCQKCVATTRALDKKGIDYELIKVDPGSEQFQRLQEEGFKSFPIVKTLDQEWSDFRPDLIAAL